MFLQDKDNIFAHAIASSLGVGFISLFPIGLIRRLMNVDDFCSMDCGDGVMYGAVVAVLFFPFALIFGKKYANFFKIVALTALGVFIVYLLISVLLGVFNSA